MKFYYYEWPSGEGNGAYFPLHKTRGDRMEQRSMKTGYLPTDNLIIPKTTHSARPAPVFLQTVPAIAEDLYITNTQPTCYADYYEN
jgi:hypothetical protein